MNRHHQSNDVTFSHRVVKTSPAKTWVTTRNVSKLYGLLQSTGCPLFFNIDFPGLFQGEKMKIHDLSAQHIFPSKRYTTYECIPELVVTVPSARSTIVKKIKRFIIWLYKWSRVTFTVLLLSAVVKIPWHHHHFPWLFRDLWHFPWLSRPGKWSS